MTAFQTNLLVHGTTCFQDSAIFVVLLWNVFSPKPFKISRQRSLCSYHPAPDSLKAAESVCLECDPALGLAGHTSKRSPLWLCTNLPLSPEHFAKLLLDIQSCAESARDWMACNKLRMNDKTEIMPVGTKAKLKSVPQTSPLTLSGSTIPFSSILRAIFRHGSTCQTSADLSF